MTERVGKIIGDVNATMRLEGMPLTTEDKEMIRRYLERESSFKAESQKIFQEIRGSKLINIITDMKGHLITAILIQIF